MNTSVVDLVIVGPTASGKTTLAIDLARALGNMELVSVDAMAIYRGLDIGTAKPRGNDRIAVAWHGLDLVDASEEFSVAEFKSRIDRSLLSIADSGARAILVGGSGLYHRVITDGLLLPGRFPEVARALEEQADLPGGLEGLYQRLIELDALGAARMEPTNRRRIVRGLEVSIGSGRPFSSYGPGLKDYPPVSYQFIGLKVDRDELDRRIEHRLEEQLREGLVDEVRAVAKSPLGLSRTARQALGYRELLLYLDGLVSFDEAVTLILQRTKRFARRQEAWFRRDPRVQWIDTTNSSALSPALELLESARKATPKA